MYTVQGMPSRGGRARHTVLTGAGLCDDALGPEAFGQQGLTHRVVDLVGTGVREILALQKNLRAPTLAQGGRRRQRRRTAYPALELLLEFRLKIRLMQIAIDTGLQPIERRHQGFRHVTAANGAEAALGVRQ
jgi:hypothetical protein